MHALSLTHTYLHTQPSSNSEMLPASTITVKANLSMGRFLGMTGYVPDKNVQVNVYAQCISA